MHLNQIIYRLTHRIPTVGAHTAYQAWASSYDQREDNAFLYAEERALVPLLASLDFAGKDVLDFGCGTGRHLSRCVGRQARSLVGTDFSRQMLEHAAAKSSPTESFTLLEASIEALPFRNSRFDIGIAALVLSHCSSLSAPISEMSRVLKSGSMVLVSDWHPENDRRGWKRSFKVTASDGSTNRCAAKSHAHSLTEYEREFRRHGFVLEHLIEPAIDESLEPIFRRRGMMRVFAQYLGAPIVMVMVLRKS